MAIICMIILVMFLILLLWSWHNLGNVDNRMKIISFLVGVVLVYIFTFIVFNVSKIGVVYDKIESMRMIRKVYVILFTIINGYLILPFSYKRIEKIYNDELNDESFKKSIVFLIIMIVLLSVIEIVYFKNVQVGIINMK